MRAQFCSWHRGELVLTESSYRSDSGSGAVVVVQQAAQALAPLDLTGIVEVASLWTDELVRQALMIALGMIMGDEILNSCPQRFLAEEDYALQAGLLDATYKDASYKSLCVGVQIG